MRDSAIRASLALALAGASTLLPGPVSARVSEPAMTIDAANALLPDARNNLGFRGFSTTPIASSMQCTTTAGSAAVSGCDSTAGLAVGELLNGPGIAAGTTVAGSINANGFTMSAPAGAGAEAGIVSARGPFWSDTDGGQPTIWRIDGRVMLGNAVGVLDSRSGTYSDFCPDAGYCANWIPRDSDLAVMSPVGGIAVSGTARASDAVATGLAAGALPASIGLAGAAIADAQNPVWAGYFDVQHEAAADGQASFGLEIALKNKGANYTSNPYSPQPGAIGIRIDTGDPSYGGDSTNPINDAIDIISTNTAVHTFNTGIVFGAWSLTPDANGHSNAIAMGAGQQIKWFARNNVDGFTLRSDVATSGHDVQEIAADDLLDFRGNRGQDSILQLAQAPATVAANYLSIGNAAAGGAPQVSAVGSDPNVSLNLVTKGTGVVQANGFPVPFIAAQSGVAVTNTGIGTAEVNMASIHLPPLGPNDAIRITALWDTTGSVTTNSKKLVVRLSPTACTPLSATPCTSGDFAYAQSLVTAGAVSGDTVTVIRNAGARNAQVTRDWSNATYGLNGNPPKTMAIDTSAGAYILLNSQTVTATTDTIKLLGYTVEVLPGR
ncbi:MAG TPA: hypothetical protein VFX06_11545 [Stellaceae bacterium]|nr:hypothetical protein [Stellaceae bacterium]